jgi:aminopeptidase N
LDKKGMTRTGLTVVFIIISFYHVGAQPESALSRNRQFSRADSLRGKLTAARSCYDVIFYHLDIAIDMEKRSVKGSNLVRFVTQEEFKRMQIDLYDNMKINKILYQGQSLTWSREHNAVFIDFPRIQKPGEQSEIQIHYEGVPKEPDLSIPMDGGILWDIDEKENSWAQMVCQGSGASLWWPNKDHLSDEPDSMKIWITVPSEYTEISNGRLLNKTELSNNKTRYEWFVSYPINNYNVTFNIGKYSHDHDTYVSDDTLTIDLYMMSYNKSLARQLFNDIKSMLRVFEKYFGKYPFPRDGFTIVESIYPMEHQSGVCIGKITEGITTELQRLLWHESAHEWWGNSVSCKDMADLWIHEAFATYAEILMIEHTLGHGELSYVIADLPNAVLGNDPVIGVYDVNHIHYAIDDMYSKGCLTLITLKNILDNDTLWIELMRDIQKRFRYQTISSNDLIQFINQRTKKDWTYFFNQYLLHVDLPVLQIKLQPNLTDLKIKFRWQASVTDFKMPVKITSSPENFEFIYPTKDWQEMTIKNLTFAEFRVDDEHFYIIAHVESE